MIVDMKQANVSVTRTLSVYASTALPRANNECIGSLDGETTSLCFFWCGNEKTDRPRRRLRVKSKDGSDARRNGPWIVVVGGGARKHFSFAFVTAVINAVRDNVGRRISGARSVTYRARNVTCRRDPTYARPVYRRGFSQRVSAEKTGKKPIFGRYARLRDSPGDGGGVFCEYFFPYIRISMIIIKTFVDRKNRRHIHCRWIQTIKSVLIAAKYTKRDRSTDRSPDELDGNSAYRYDVRVP